MPASPLPDPALSRLAVDAVRVLSMDAVQKANSGHPGAPMGLAPVAYLLWTRHLRHNPANPEPGATAIASCCPPGTPPCSSTRCFT